jgi:hypothetical protein
LYLVGPIRRSSSNKTYSEEVIVIDSLRLQKTNISDEPIIVQHIKELTVILIIIMTCIAECTSRTVFTTAVR